MTPGSPMPPIRQYLMGGLLSIILVTLPLSILYEDVGDQMFPVWKNDTSRQVPSVDDGTHL